MTRCMVLVESRHTTAELADLAAFQSRVDDAVHSHPVVVDNRYTRWFATGVATRDDVRHLTVQFSVFSHLFVEAQLRKVINAADLDTYRAGKEILMNELGVIFKPGRVLPADDTVDPELAATEGPVDGRRFRLPAAHTADELAEAFFMDGFDEERFLAGAREMLDGVKAFWDGLESDRHAARRARP